MSKYAAFGVTLAAGIAQVETATIVGTITGSGDAHIKVTAVGMTGTGNVIDVAVTDLDLPSTVARKIAAKLTLTAGVLAFFEITAVGDDVILRARTAAADDATMNLAYTNDSCTGLTPDATSTHTLAGVAPVTIAGVKSIGGPGLSVDTEDVTTHDSVAAFEEVVATIIRSGQVTLEIVYDPGGATHLYAAGGVLYRLATKQYSWFNLTFRSTYNWRFSGFVTGFEPSEPAAGAITATVNMKITGQPILE